MVEVSAKVLEWYEAFQFHLALEEAIGFVRAINKYADERAPWKLAKSDEEDKKDFSHKLGYYARRLTPGQRTYSLP